MKKKLLALVLVVALAASALSLAACGSDFANIYSNPYENKAYSAYLNDPLKVLDSKTDLNLDAFASQVHGNCNLSIFTAQDENGNNVYKVYNYETNAVVLTLTESETVTYAVNANVMYVGDTAYDFITVQKTTTPEEGDPTVEFTVYYADGTVALSYDQDAQTKVLWVDRTFFIDGDYYRIDKKGKFAKAGSIAKNAVEYLPNFTSLVNERYYSVSEGTLSVYDYSFNLTNYYEVPSYAENNANFFVLNDGNVLIQYEFSVSPLESNYTYYNGQNNMKVVTLIYNVKNAETKEIETVALFAEIVARDDVAIGSEIKYLFDDSVKNVAGVQFITNKQLDTNYKEVSVKNDGSIDVVLDDVFVAVSRVEPHSSGKFIVSTKLDTKYLVDKKGKVVADITDATYNEKYIFVNGKVYDFDFKELATVDEDKWEFFGEMNNSFVFRCIDEEDENAAKKFKLFANGSMKDITLADGESLAGGDSRYYVVENNADTTTYIYYNENGEKIFDTTDVLLYKGTARNGKMLFSASKWDETAGKTVYTNVVLYAK